jgi:hypothetical protein
VGVSNCVCAPVAEGFQKASCRRTMLGCATRRWMHTSRSTLRALSRSRATSGMRLSATCNDRAGCRRGRLPVSGGGRRACTGSVHDCDHADPGDVSQCDSPPSLTQSAGVLSMQPQTAAGAHHCACGCVPCCTHSREAAAAQEVQELISWPDLQSGGAYAGQIRQRPLPDHDLGKLSYQIAPSSLQNTSHPMWTRCRCLGRTAGA